MDFKALKKKSNFNLDKLVEAAKSNNQSKRGADERVWKPSVDKNGNGFAVLRFLPSEGDLPWVRYFDHGFKGPTGQYLVDTCPTTIGEDCPVCKYNQELWATGTEENQRIVRSQKRRLNYVTNILVVADKAHPENEGKVFMYRFGKKIFDKLMDAMQPDEAFDEQPVNPFDIFEGANFNLKICTVDKFQNYDKSAFAAPSALYDGDEKKVQAVLDQIYDIDKEYLSPEKFQSYEALDKRLHKVLGISQPVTTAKQVQQEQMEEQQQPEPVNRKVNPAKQAPVAEEVAEVIAEGDDTLSYFQSLADED